ncbi:TetR/AcrR family transcriptional regulator [Stigmatella erecta]|uniref:Transcriptional regulator, TetR family n=1 Tax=Stigmatella erecta TaxID=83460 RepID=A0A1I0L3U6_9BACT|nr:TetR/AcrR family transcriptional regulator [Stigmatella erecta]SEU34141.1 transcriptional regulator, TetR family [Stigmatella erecta]
MAMGRPRAFNIDEAVEQALQVFLSKGYEGASLADLTQAMGINPPSLYSAFGSKEGLFRKALERYAGERGACLSEALAQPTARAVVEHLLRAVAGLQTGEHRPQGCLLVQGALVCGDAAEPIREELASRRGATQRALQVRLERAKKEGDLPRDANPAALALFVSILIQGMAVHASAGTRREELHQAVDVALLAWETKSRPR